MEYGVKMKREFMVGRFGIEDYGRQDMKISDPEKIYNLPPPMHGEVVVSPSGAVLMSFGTFSELRRKAKM